MIPAGRQRYLSVKHVFCLVFFPVFCRAVCRRDSPEQKRGTVPTTPCTLRPLGAPTPLPSPRRKTKKNVPTRWVLPPCCAPFLLQSPAPTPTFGTQPQQHTQQNRQRASVSISVSKCLSDSRVRAQTAFPSLHQDPDSQHSTNAYNGAKPSQLPTLYRVRKM